MNQQTTPIALKEKETPLTMGTSTMIDQTLSQRVQARAIKDASFRQALVSAPRHVLTREFNLALNEAVTIRVVEDTPNTLTLVLSPQEVSFQELTDADLEKALEEALICYTTTCQDPTDPDYPSSRPPDPR
jgi:hypothetical protein